jgi:integrase
VRIAAGIRLGYRRIKTAGRWNVIAADGRGSNWMKAFATADDYEEANGDSVLDFWQAQERARALARNGRDGDATSGDPNKPTTISEALDTYQADLRTRGGDVSSVARVRKHLPPALSGKLVALLNMRQLRDWRDRLGEKVSAGSVNRIITSLRAALNLAAERDERIANRRAWEIGLQALGDAVESRNVILMAEPIHRIVRESYVIGDDFGLLVETLAITGTRISQAARLEVDDLRDHKDTSLMMPVSRKGRGQKKITHRPVPIPTSLAARLRLTSNGMPASAPLLRKADGDQWRKSVHSRPFALAVKRAGLDSAEVTIAALRHSSIVRQLLANVPIRIVAVHHDTSVAMIEKTYSKFISDHADPLTRPALLDLSEPIAGKVVVLHEQ